MGEPKFTPAPHIQALLDAESSCSVRLMWGRTSKNQIWIATVGYIHQEHMDLEAVMMKLGCRLDVAKGVQDFDRMSGRTFTHFKEPKTKLSKES